MHTLIEHRLAHGAVHLQLPAGSVLVDVGEDAMGRAVIFALVDTDRPTVWRDLHVAETRQPLPDAIAEKLAPSAVLSILNIPAPRVFVGSTYTKAGHSYHVFDLGERVAVPAPPPAPADPADA